MDRLNLLRNLETILARDYWGTIQPEWFGYAADYIEGTPIDDMTDDPDEQESILALAMMFEEAMKE